jgi:hypothetical protein
MTVGSCSEGLFPEKARLAEGGTDAGHMEKHLLEYAGATP